MSITIGDFKPVNDWKVDRDGETWFRGGSKFIIDQTTKKRYLNEDHYIIEYKCFLLTLGTPFVHLAATVINVAYRVLKLGSLSHFWVERVGEKNYNLKGRVADAAKDVLRLLASATFVTYVALELSATYGILRPYDGRKLYATFERATYEDSILAPCFQPEPKRHFFGGNIDEKNAF